MAHGIYGILNKIRPIEKTVRSNYNSYWFAVILHKSISCMTLLNYQIEYTQRDVGTY